MELYAVHVRFNARETHAVFMPRHEEVAAAASFAATVELSLATWLHECCVRSQVLTYPAWLHAGEYALTRRELQPES